MSSKKGLKEKSGKKLSFRQKCTDLITQIQHLLKGEEKKKSVGKKSIGKKKVAKKKVVGKRRKMIGGDNLIQDIQRAGKGLGLSMVHTFDSISNLGKDMYCETDAIMNIPRELDLGYTQDCPFTKTKSWDWEKIKQ